MRAARNKTKIRLIQNIKREITSRIKKKTLNHSHIQTHTHSHKHTNVDLHTNTLTLVEVNTQAASLTLDVRRKRKQSHIHLSAHTHTARVSKMRNKKSRYVRQFHQFCLFFVYQNLGNLLPKFYFWKTKKHRWKEKKTPVPEEEEHTKTELLRNTLKCNLTTLHRKLKRSTFRIAQKIIRRPENRTRNLLLTL